MTDYPSLAGRHSWRRRQDLKKWQNLVAILIILLLVLAIINGLLKTFSFGKYLGDSQWDGRSSFAVVLATDPILVAVFQNDPKRVVFLAVDGEGVLITPNVQERLVKIGGAIKERSGEKLGRLASLAFRADIDSYIMFSESPQVDKEKSLSLFKDFASITYGPLILFKGIGQGMDTNLARIDLFKLWWKAKNISVERIEFIDLRGEREEIVYQDKETVLGVDTVSYHQAIVPYLDNLEIAKENFKVAILNGSQVTGAGSLAADMAQAAGVKVVGVQTSSYLVERCQISAADKSSYTAFYLAKIFKCDIKSAPTEADTGEIMLIVGNDFADKYF